MWEFIKRIHLICILIFNDCSSLCIIKTGDFNMAYKALYRTYRPTTFEEVAGQQHIVQTIKNALATGKIAHAYLFAGPRGTGKTTMAKLLAKALNCEHGIGCQCNECKNCVAINEGTHPDVLEIDAASNNSVDEVRDLIDKVKYGTILGRYKVYIIDEVHMMTPSAFNALLKTLEEPPEHVIFILATTEPHKILPTILSRCQRYDFSKVSDEDIKERIQVVLEKENITYNEEAVNLIISLADGGMRDALSILDQVLAYSGDQLNVQDVLDIFALESSEEKIALIHSIINSDINDILRRLSSYIERGTDIKRLTNDLLMMLKDVMIYSSSRSSQYLQVLSESQAEELSDALNPDTTMEMITVLLDTLKDYKNVTSINPLFEVSLLKLAGISKQPQPVREEVRREESKLRPIPQPVREEPKPEPVYEQPKVESPKEEPKPVVEPEQPKVEETVSLFEDDSIASDDSVIYINGAEEEDHYLIDEKTMVDIMVTSKKDIKNQMLENWKNLKRLSAHPSLGRIASMLVDGHPLVVSTKVMVLEYQSDNVVEKMNLIENQKVIQNVIKTVFNRKMFIYAVNRKQSIDLQQKYMNLLQLGRLPKADTVNIEFIGD